MNPVKTRSFSTAFLIVVILAACGETKTTNPEKPKVNVLSDQVQDYRGGEAILEAHFAASGAKVGTGNIKADGSFNLTLAESIAAETLPAVSAPCEGVTITPQTFKGDAVLVSVVQNGQTTGTLIQTTSLNAVAGTTSYVSRFYVDRDVRLIGTCLSDTFNLTLKKGWNLALYEIRSSASQPPSSKASTIETTDLPWFFAAEQQPPQP
jgi:hypothetical protein